MATHIDLDIDALRADILRRQHDAMKPFQEELRKLDIVEAVLRGQAESPGIGALPERGLRKRPSAKRQSEPKPNGQHRPYAEMSQVDAILALVGQAPGLFLREIATRLLDGGLVFRTKKPVSSVSTTLRELARQGRIVAKKQYVAERYPGQTAHALHYYPKGHRAADKPAVRENSMNAAVLGVVQGAPDGGYDRGEVVALLEKAKFAFPEHGEPRTRVTWALNNMVERGLIERHKRGTNPSDSRFTAVKGA